MPLGLGVPGADTSWVRARPKFRAMAQQHSNAAAATPRVSLRFGTFAVIINTAHLSFRGVFSF
jgi:hypothetical protein